MLNLTNIKKLDPNSLRAKYGTTKIRNELHGSDNPIEANKERDIFKFPIPQKIPDFKYDKFKLTLETIFKFLYPPNLEHSYVNSRLDIFALHGPVKSILIDVFVKKILIEINYFIGSESSLR